MLFTSAFSVLSLLSLASAAPAHRRSRERDAVHKAVLAFTAPPPAPAAPSPVEAIVAPGRPQVLAAGQQDGEEGHWRVFTTSEWIAGEPAPTSTSDSSPISSFVSDLDAPVLGASLCVGTDCQGSSESATLTDSSSAVTTAESASNAAPPTITASYTPQPTSGGGGSNGGNYDPNKHVFAHFMVGIVSTYKAEHWETDIQLAKSKGISGFALNIGVDDYSQAQLDLAYDAAQKIGDFVMFISFDFNWYKVDDVNGVATMMKRYVDKPAQFLKDGKPFVSSFIGDGFNWAAVESQIGKEIYAVPFYQPSAEHVNAPGVSGLFSWAAWPGQLDNQPVLAAMSTDRDETYISQLSASSKSYMAPISPWFFTHFGPEVPYSKNWLFYSEDLWKTRWDQVLQMGQQGVDFVEIITWNDYGEGHNIGPYTDVHTDDGSSKYAKDMDHTAMLDFSVPYIEAFKRGQTAPVIDKEMLVYWHRPTLKDVNCDGSDNCGSKPKGWEMVEDSVFVAVMTKNGATVTVTSGSNAPQTHTVEAGVQMVTVPMGKGDQKFEIKSNDGLSATGTSKISVLDTCWNGIYNYNFHSGLLS